MLAADAAVASTHAQMRVTKQALKQAKRAITHAKRAHRNTTAIVAQRSAHLAKLEARYAGVPPEGIPGGFADRLRSVRRDVSRAKAHRQAVGRLFRAAIRARSARRSRLNVLRRSLRSAVARRESAEDGLGAYIVQLTRLAAQRAEDPVERAAQRQQRRLHLAERRPHLADLRLHRFLPRAPTWLLPALP